MLCGRKSSQHVANAVQDAGNGGYFARPNLVQPEATDNRAHTKKENGKRKVQLHLGFRPVLGSHQRDLEHAPAVHGAEADLHDDGGNRNTPPIRQTVRSHRTLLVYAARFLSLQLLGPLCSEIQITHYSVACASDSWLLPATSSTVAL